MYYIAYQWINMPLLPCGMLAGTDLILALPLAVSGSASMAGPARMSRLTQAMPPVHSPGPGSLRLQAGEGRCPPRQGALRPIPTGKIGPGMVQLVDEP